MFLRKVLFKSIIYLAIKSLVYYIWSKNLRCLRGHIVQREMLSLSQSRVVQFLTLFYKTLKWSLVAVTVAYRVACLRGKWSKHVRLCCIDNFESFWSSFVFQRWCSIAWWRMHRRPWLPGWEDSRCMRPWVMPHLRWTLFSMQVQTQTYHKCFHISGLYTHLPAWFGPIMPNLVCVRYFFFLYGNILYVTLWFS